MSERLGVLRVLRISDSRLDSKMTLMTQYTCEMLASKFRGLVPAMYPFSDEERLCVCNTIITTYLLLKATTAVDEPGKTWQLLSNAWCFFDFFGLWFLLFLTLLADRHSDSTPGSCCCLFPLLLWVFLWMYRLISVVIFSRNEHGVVVEWMSACVCLVSACWSSWYVLYLFERSEFLIRTLQKKGCVFVCVCVPF